MYFHFVAPSCGRILRDSLNRAFCVRGDGIGGFRAIGAEFVFANRGDDKNGCCYWLMLFSEILLIAIMNCIYECEPTVRSILSMKSILRYCVIL